MVEQYDCTILCITLFSFQHIFSAIYSVLFQHVHGKNVTFLFSCSRMLNDSLPVKPLSILFQLCLKRIDLKFAVQLHNDKLHIQFTCCTRSELKLNQREKREDQGFFFYRDPSVYSILSNTALSGATFVTIYEHVLKLLICTRLSYLGSGQC